MIVEETQGRRAVTLLTPIMRSSAPHDRGPRNGVRMVRLKGAVGFMDYGSPHIASREGLPGNGTGYFDRTRKT